MVLSRSCDNFPPSCHNLVQRDPNHLDILLNITLAHPTDDMVPMRLTEQDLWGLGLHMCFRGWEIKLTKLQGLAMAASGVQWSGTSWEVLSRC